MLAYKFLYPISDSGYLFELELLEIIKEKKNDKMKLSIRYSLKNRYPSDFVIPVNISHEVYLNCSHENDFDDDTCKSISSNTVLNLQNEKTMHGYGDDHYVEFLKNETREFMITFRPVKNDIKTFDMEYFMKPEDDKYGLYRIRYDFTSNKIVKCFCIRTYEKRFKEPSQKKKKS